MLSRLFDNLPIGLPSEGVRKLLESEKLRVERIVSPRRCTLEGFWSNHPEHEWVIVL